MNVFHIPSWYPTKHSLYEGVFIKEFIELFSAKHKDICHIISNHRENSYAISIHPNEWLTTLKSLFAYLIYSDKQDSGGGNRRMYYSPKYFTYSKKLGFNWIDTLLKYHLRNFESAVKDLGPVSIIHAHVTYPGGIIAQKIAEIKKIPYLITEHLGPFLPPVLENKPEIKSQIISALDHANYLVAVSHAHARQIANYTSNNIEVIPNCVNESFFNQSVRDPCLENTHTKVKFLSITTLLDSSKGIPQLLYAIKDIAGMGKHFHFLIGGTDKNMQEVIELSKKLNITDKITFFETITREEVKNKMQECDVFVLPSESESFGMVYAEAIACGKPVIATKCGGPEDIINEKNGILINRNNHNELVDALLFMYRSFKDYSSDEIREDFLNRFSSELIIERYLKMYSEISSIIYK